MQVVLPELVSCELYEYGLIEPGVTAFFIEVVRPGTIVYDIGAHLGYYSILASALGATVHAFEPSRTTLPLLRRNASAGVSVAWVGLWHEETTLPLLEFGPEHSAVTTFVSARDEELGEPDAVYPMPVTTLDRHVNETGHMPDVVKIDAEGAELQVLQGARNTLEAATPLVTIEVGDARGERTSRSVIDFATELGYVPYELSDQGLHPHRLRKVYDYGNLLLLPRATDPTNFRRFAPLHSRPGNTKV